MRKIKSIFYIFLVFLLMILTGFLFLYGYSRSSLRSSVMEAVQIQMEYTYTLLEQKLREIEIEAEGILGSDDLRNLHNIIHTDYDSYDYVVAVTKMKTYLTNRQKSNVGMSEFILYWPETGRVISTSLTTGVDAGIFEELQDNRWFIKSGELYLARKYQTKWEESDDEPFLLIKMERDYLYRLKNMAAGIRNGGAFLMMPDGGSLFPIQERENDLYEKIAAHLHHEAVYTLSVDRVSYQILESESVQGGLRIITYYPLNSMMRQVGGITWIMGISLALLAVVGLAFMILYYKNILLQLHTLTEKLQQVEQGDFSIQITELPDNEFSYVFEQFNRMVTRIDYLMESTIKEQQLRNQAELRQLQLQINPHFLYNSLSYIVTVAKKPEAVTDMAVHLARYYRYCTHSREIVTIGEELSYARSYLSIMAMRKNITYTISAPESLQEVEMIPLILQPVIENAIEHGIEERENAKNIYVKVQSWNNRTIKFEISDDGNGMTEAQIKLLEERLYKKYRDDSESVGLWNVNQRLINYYDESAGLRFGKSIWGGLLVTFVFQPKIRGGGNSDDSFDC